MEKLNLSNDSEVWLERLLGETLIFSLLGKIIYTQPDRAWLDSLYQDDVFTESPFAMQQPDVVQGLALLHTWGHQSNGINDAKIEDLAVDNTRLFVGVGKVLAPLWESVYFSEERLIFQESTLDVRNWYRRFGLEPENLHREPDDHIGLEMEFIAYMANLARQALEAGELENCEDLIQAQRQFFSQHLLRFAYQWCLLVIEHAKTDFYRGLAYLVRGSITELAQLFNLPVPKEVVK
jgi:TorA maturation chaperone TorD